MKLETFFEKFDLFADAPDAVSEDARAGAATGGAGNDLCESRSSDEPATFSR